MHDLERAGIEIVNIIDDARIESETQSSSIVEFRQPDALVERKRQKK